MAEGHSERMTLLFAELLATYLDARDILLSLPVPIDAPRVPTIGWVDIRLLMVAFDAAAESVMDEPIPPVLGELIAEMLLTWSGAAILVQTAQVNEEDLFYVIAARAVRHTEHGVGLCGHLLATLDE